MVQSLLLSTTIPSRIVKDEIFFYKNFIWEITKYNDENNSYFTVKRRSFTTLERKWSKTLFVETYKKL